MQYSNQLKINNVYNIVRVLALCKSYWAAMEMMCSAVFFVSFPKYSKIDGSDKSFLGFFRNLASL